jgi:hypothetical protein
MAITIFEISTTVEYVYMSATLFSLGCTSTLDGEMRGRAAGAVYTGIYTYIYICIIYNLYIYGPGSSAHKCLPLPPVSKGWGGVLGIGLLTTTMISKRIVCAGTRLDMCCFAGSWILMFGPVQEILFGQQFRS